MSKSKQVAFKISDNLYKQLQKVVGKYSLSTSAYLRHLVISDIKREAENCDNTTQEIQTQDEQQHEDHNKQITTSPDEANPNQNPNSNTTEENEIC